MPTTPNFILENGAVAHNCKAHSTTYSQIAYACAFLKYHYPIEWWTAVLSNADKKKIKEKLWAHCKDLVDLPDVRYSGERFTIKDNRIIAPLSMLQGVGENAHLELIENFPYQDIRDFCNKIYETKKKKGSYVVKKKKVTVKSNFLCDDDEGHVEEIEEKVFKAGRSALTRGVVNKLIVSGVADSLFPEGMDLVSKLEMFEKALAESHGKKRPDKIDPKYRDINSLDIYQLRKQILEVYSSYIPPLLHDLKVDGVGKRTVKISDTETMDTFSYFPEDPKTIGHILESMGRKQMPSGGMTFINGKLLKYMNEDAHIEEGHTIRVVAGAYVNDIRKFDYTDKKSLKRVEACEIILDIDGEILKTVKWPDRKTHKLVLPEGELKDSIVIAILSRWNPKYPFGLDALIKVKEPLIEKSDND